MNLVPSNLDPSSTWNLEPSSLVLYIWWLWALLVALSRMLWRCAWHVAQWPKWVALGLFVWHLAEIVAHGRLLWREGRDDVLVGGPTCWTAALGASCPGGLRRERRHTMYLLQRSDSAHTL